MNITQIFSLLSDVDVIPTENQLYNILIEDLKNEQHKLEKYRNKALLIVNIASRCGFTKQLKELELLYKNYHKQGLEIIGIPTDDFFQEPYNNDQIHGFCLKNYGVSFPILNKTHVRNQNKHPLYAFLTSRKTNPKFSGRIKWNFSKFLIDEQGNVKARFSPFTKPNSKKVMRAIENLLKKDAGIVENA